MKRLCKAICYILLFPLSLIFNNHIIAFNKKIASIINTINFKRQLKKHGKNYSVTRMNKFEGLNNVTIGNDFSSQDGLWLAAYNEYNGFKHNPEIIIGNNCHFSRNCHIGAINKIIIGDNLLAGSNVMINDHTHGQTDDFSAPRNELDLYSKGSITIGNNVFIGDNTIIMPGVTIGNNVVIGANSIVNKSIEEDNVLVAGIPATVVKRFS